MRKATLVAGALALAALAGRAVRAQEEETVGPPKPVEVVNPPSRPLPVSGTVSGTVTIGNTPDVRVVNTPSVSVANTPSVSVVNVPSVNARQAGAWTVSVDLPVEVLGTVNAAQSGNWLVRLDPAGNLVRLEPDAVLTVRDVSAAALEPFQAELVFQTDGEVTVPADRRLVIETVTLVAFGDEQTGFYQPFIVTTAGGQTVQHLIATTIHPFTEDGEAISRYYQGTASVRLYADPGTQVRFVEAFSGATRASRVSISGHLVPATP